MSDKALIMYSRTIPCPDCERARQLLEAHAVPFREVMIDQDPAAQSFVEALTGYRSVPTLVVARPDGSVEGHLEGEEAAVRWLIDLIYDGPGGARVDRVEARDSEVEGFAGFEVRH